MCVYERERSGGWGCSVWVERAGERGSFEGGIPLKRAKEASHSEWYSNAISRYKDFVKFALLWILAADCLCPLYWLVYSPSVWAEDEKTTQMKKGETPCFPLNYAPPPVLPLLPRQITLATFASWLGMDTLLWRWQGLTQWPPGPLEVDMKKALAKPRHWNPPKQQVIHRASDYVFKDYVLALFPPVSLPIPPEAFNADYFNTGTQTPALTLNGISRLTP